MLQTGTTSTHSRSFQTPARKTTSALTATTSSFHPSALSFARNVTRSVSAFAARSSGIPFARSTHDSVFGSHVSSVSAYPSSRSDLPSAARLATVAAGRRFDTESVAAAGART